MKKLSPTQRDVVEKLKLTNSYLHRVDGGFWTFDGVGYDARGVPNWWVTIQTVRAMEKAGWLKREEYYVDEEWKDFRSLTAKAVEEWKDFRSLTAKAVEAK